MTCRSPSPAVYDWQCWQCCIRALRSTAGNRQAAKMMLWVISRANTDLDMAKLKAEAWK